MPFGLVGVFGSRAEKNDFDGMEYGGSTGSTMSCLRHCTCISRTTDSEAIPAAVALEGDQEPIVQLLPDLSVYRIIGMEPMKKR